MKNFSELVDSIANDCLSDDKLELSMISRMIDFDTNDSPFENNAAFFKFLLEHVKNLKGVKSVSLRSNKLQKIPDFVFQLPQLENLGLSDNDISEIPVAIENLEELQVLDISNNNVQIFPEEILELRLLKVIRATRNGIIQLPEKIHHLVNLRELYATANNISEIPKSIVKLKNLNEVWLHDNPIQNVPAGIYTQGNGIDAIRNYFKKNENELSTFYGVKIIVVGDGEVGKTTIVKNLEAICCREDHPSTIGLEVKEFNFSSPNLDEGLKFKIWDFGGQGKYRTVQQLFCTPNAIYFYVTVPNSIKTPEKYGSYAYWLNFINVLGDRSPVIFVTNKIDLVDTDSGSFVDEASISKSFGFVQKFIKTRFTRKRYATEAVDQLKQAIEFCIREKSEHFNFHFEKLPNDWILLIDHLNELRKRRNFISKDRYYGICKDHEIYNKEDQEYLLNYLDKSGTILLYENETIKSDFQIILNPNWIKNAIYKVVSYLERKNKPWFRKEEVEEIWDDFVNNKEYYLDLIALTRDLNFSFSLNDKFYIPSLLPTFDHDAVKEEFIPKYTYECTFDPYIPAGLLHKLIVYNIAYVKSEEEIWENRVIFYWGKHSIPVEAVEYWTESKLVFNINSSSLAIARSISQNIRKAIDDFEGRNYINEINKEETVLYDKKSTKLENMSDYSSVDEIYRHIQIIKKEVNVNENYGNIIMSNDHWRATNLLEFNISDFTTTSFQIASYSNNIEIEKLYSLSKKTLLSTPGIREDAVFVQHNNWLQLYFNFYEVEKAIKLIRELPVNINIKFVALRKIFWNEVQERWSKLHFHKHYVYQFDIQHEESDYSFDHLRPMDVEFLAKNQKYLDEYGGVGYLTHRIHQNITACYRENDELVAWVLLHDDGTIGFLRVLDSHKGKNIGTQLLAHFINKVIKLGHQAIAQMSEYNKSSNRIAEKLDGKVIDEVAWVRERTPEEIEAYLSQEF